VPKRRVSIGASRSRASDFKKLAMLTPYPARLASLALLRLGRDGL
jgi:hypothetical protein